MENLKVKSQKLKLQFKILNFNSCLPLLTFAFLLLPSTVEACPGCKEALFDPGQLAEKMATAKGYALSIGMLLAVPFTLVAGVSLLIWHSARRIKPAVPPRVDGVDTPRKTR